MKYLSFFELKIFEKYQNIYLSKYLIDTWSDYGVQSSPSVDWGPGAGMGAKMTGQALKYLKTHTHLKEKALYRLVAHPLNTPEIRLL